jgi:hypothetical protein
MSQSMETPVSDNPMLRKGRVSVFLEKAYQPRLSGFYVKFVGSASVIGCFQELNEAGLEAWKEHLLLPEGYTLIRAYFGLNSHTWQLILETDAFSCYIDRDIPQAMPTIDVTEDGKVSIVDLGERISVTHPKYRWS